MDSADRPREIIIHQSANRPNQLMGGDRELVLVSLLTSVALAFSLASWWGLGVSVAWYVGAMAVLKRMGKADPLLRQVYMRHIRYRPFYPAKSGVYSRCLQPPMTWR
ncbi:MAG TPA: conjugal transfer protein TrbD [Bryobacteraceae bacterium]|jgi:type IV secretion system protein VirB3|nr:conjugal transfer protein TrbD [Bryobacteraceae bacterium]